MTSTTCCTRMPPSSLGRWGYTRDCLLEFERRAITPKRIRAKLLNYSRYYRSGWSDRDHGGHEPLVLFVFETPKSERSFLRFIDGVNTSPLLTSNNELIKQRGVLGDVWRTSGSETQSRVALRAYFPEDKVQLADPRDSCREDADKPKIPSTYVVRPHSGHGGNFVAVSGRFHGARRRGRFCLRRIREVIDVSGMTHGDVTTAAGNEQWGKGEIADEGGGVQGVGDLPFHSGPANSFRENLRHARSLWGKGIAYS